MSDNRILHDPRTRTSWEGSGRPRRGARAAGRDRPDSDRDRTSASDLEAVLGTVVESARRLCRADAALIYLLEDGAFRVAAATGVSDDYRDYMLGTRSSRTGPPSSAGWRSTAGAADRRRPGRPGVRPARHPASRRLPHPMGAPMLIDDEVVGVLLAVAQRGRPVQRACDRAGHDVRRPGRDRRPQRRPGPRAASPQHGARPTRSSSSRRCARSATAVSSSLDLDEVLIDDRRRTQCSCRTPTAARSWSTTEPSARVPHPRAYGSSPELLEALARPRSPWTTPSSAGPAWRGSRTDGARPRSGRRSTRTCRCCTTPDGARCSRCRCCTRA